MDEVQIKCFQHCDRARNILCFTVPAQCPLCGQDTGQTACRIPPYILPSPFVHAEAAPCCLVIKPTQECFLRDFTNTSDLHVGLTDSMGTVYEYDEAGVTVGRPDWTRCVHIQVLSHSAGETSRWDRQLQYYQSSPAWTKTRYSEQKYNCFDFVVEFLRTFGLTKCYPSLSDKLLFCQEVILPSTAKAGKFISLYRNIESSGFVIQMASGS